MREQTMDDDSLDALVMEQREDLVGQIWQYTLALERYVVKLRNQVNRLAMKAGEQLPYPEIESDFSTRYFIDHPDFHEFAAVLSAEEATWMIPD